MSHLMGILLTQWRKKLEAGEQAIGNICNGFYLPNFKMGDLIA